MHIKNIIILIAIIANVRICYGFDYDSYKPTKIKYIIAEHLVLPSGKVPTDLDSSIELFHHKIKIRAEYCGEYRKISESRRKYIARFFTSVKMLDFIKLFQNEVKIKEDGREYWVLIQEPLIQSLKDEVKPGEEADFYMLYMGITEKEYVFAVSEFQYSEELEVDIKKYDNAIKEKPDIADNYTKRSKLYLSICKFDEATSDVLKVIELQPKDHTSFYNCAVSYYERGLSSYTNMKDFETAIKYFDKALELNDKDAQYHIAKGFSHYELGEWEKALKSIGQAVKLNPEFETQYQEIINICKTNMEKKKE